MHRSRGIVGKSQNISIEKNHSQCFYILIGSSQRMQNIFMVLLNNKANLIPINIKCVESFLEVVR